MRFSDKDLTAQELERFGAARARDAAYDAVMKLWRARKAKGLTQKKLAENIGRDQGWLSRYFGGPGNWTLKTLGAFAQALDGELEIRIIPLENTQRDLSNSDAYSGYTLDVGTRVGVQSPAANFGTTQFGAVPLIQRVGNLRAANT